MATTPLLLIVVPVISLVTTLSIPWEPVGADVDAEDFADTAGEPASRPAQAAGRA